MTKKAVFEMLIVYRSLSPETQEDRAKQIANVNYLIGYADGKGWKYPKVKTNA